MRKELENPLPKTPELRRVIEAVRKLYRLHEAGINYSEPLASLSKGLSKELHKSDIDAAFGSINPETYAKKLLVDDWAIPTDLSYEELLELVEKIVRVQGDEFQIEYWLRCLEINTENDCVLNLIYWPNLYFGNDDVSLEMTPKEILDEALRERE